jgi:arylsulfatase A-like enzyme
MGRRGAFSVVLGVLLAARAASVIAHHLLRTPAGARVAEHPFSLIPATLAGEAGTIAVLGVLAGLVSWISPRAALAILTLGGILLLFLSQLDLELVRWTGEHLNPHWFGAYDLLADARLLESVLLGDTLAVAVALLLVAVPSLAILAIARRRGPERLDGRAVAVLAVLSFAGLASQPLLAPTPLALRRARPALVGLVSESLASLGDRPSTRELHAGLVELQRFLNRPPGWFRDPGYPVWHAAPAEEESYARFRARPLSERPDVVLVVLESARGWETDFGRPSAETRVPALHRLWRERGVSFPFCVATGYPSIEGWGGIFLGLAGHPSGILLYNARHLRALSIGEILARAGYRRELVAATSTAFEKMEDWYARWFDDVRYDPSETTDEVLGTKTIDLLGAAREKPLFLTLFTIATHPPLYRPPDAPAPKTPREAYLAALGYTDRQLGRIFEALRATPRGRDTIVLVVGDHATPNPWQAIRLPRLGTPNAGENWTTLLVAAKGLSGGTLRPELTSQLDVAPTLLGLLGLDVSNHFLGRDLLTAPPPPPQGVLALRFHGLAAFEGPFLYQARLDDPVFQQKWRWEVYEKEADAANGDYHHGVAETLSASDHERIAELKKMARAWGAVLDDDRVMPPR